MQHDIPREGFIGIWDSGVGGLTVMKAIVELLPFESIIYFGDTARMPYGSKSAETIQRYSIENSLFLLEYPLKALVVACNTASALGIDKLRRLFHLPILGTIDTGAAAVLQVTRNKKIGILGTRATINSQACQRALLSADPHLEITAVACPLLAQLVEEQLFDHPATRLFLQEYLEPIAKSRADTLLLACTHYPLLAHLIKELLPQITIIDCAEACALALKDILEAHSITKERDIATHRFFVSDDPQKFQSLGAHFFGKSINEVNTYHHSQR